MLLSIAMNKLRAWRAYRETVFQLESLPERELSDLGIGRRDIKRRAREASEAARHRITTTPKPGAVRLPNTSPAR